MCMRFENGQAVVRSQNACVISRPLSWADGDVLTRCHAGFFSKSCHFSDFAEAIAGSTFIELPHTGHLSARESPELFNTAVDYFLRRLTNRTA